MPVIYSARGEGGGGSTVDRGIAIPGEFETIEEFQRSIQIFLGILLERSCVV